MENLLKTEDVMKYFNVKDKRTISKFIKMGLEVIPIGSKDFRFKKEDLETFTELLKNQAQQKITTIDSIKRKTKNKTINIDYEKIRINKELNKVV